MFKWGTIAAIIMLIGFYVLQIIGMQSFSAPYYFMIDKWYYVFPLVIGFGLQFALFKEIRQKTKQSSTVIIGSVGVSTGSMIACCLHNLVLLFPILGLSGLAIFLSAYQDYLFIFSIISVFFGTFYMYRVYRRIKQEEMLLKIIS